MTSSGPATIARLHRALANISLTPARLIASPPVAPGGGPARRASVAIIIRLRPEHSPSSSAASSPRTSSSSPLSPPPTSAPALPLDPSSPSSSRSPASFSPPPPASPTQPSASLPINQNENGGTGGGVQTVLNQLEEFFKLDWVNSPGTTIEVLYIKRASRASDKWSGHVAFPGGRSEPDDESAEFTAMRETWEEVGLDLAERDWISIGQLDDREITSSLGKRLLMILSPFVFLHTSPHAPIPELQETEVASAHWIPLELLHAPTARYGAVDIDIASRLAPKNKVARAALKMLVGQMSFKCILLPNDPISLLPGVPRGDKLPDLRLWGLTLGMTLDLLSHMTLSRSASDLSTYPYAIAALDKPLDNQSEFPLESTKKTREGTLNPFASSSEASIFPRFSYPDINLLIWIFGWRYRRLLRSHPSSGRAPLTPRTPSTIPTYRVNWAGMSLNAYYAAVRRALVVAVLMRACLAVGTVVGVGWWVGGWWRGKKRLRVIGK
ncbi:NUDIX hydrolase [Sporobolomyces salmoneus]|uniref:NUDIX hydrolase n=1 Tax=Sporobolomyces salmoneus TaxID=183962 RepID=UPI00316EE285